MVKSYNSLMKDSAGVSDSTTGTRLSSLMKVADSFSSKLSSIGITVDDDNGLLSLDKDKMKSAGMDAVKSVIGNRNGFAGQVSSVASQIEKAAKSAASSKSLYNANASTASSGYSSLLDSYI